RHFRQADGTVLARWTGGVILRVLGIQTWDQAAFAEPGDLILLGAHSLEGLNLRIDPVSKQLIDAGPAPAGVSSRRSGSPHIAPEATVRPPACGVSYATRFKVRAGRAVRNHVRVRPSPGQRGGPRAITAACGSRQS